MATLQATELPKQPTMLLPLRELLKIMAAGAGIGLITVALHYMLDTYVFSSLLCGGTNQLAPCDNKIYFASGTAMVLGALIGLFVLIRQRVYRPLLVVLLVTSSLWNVIILMSAFPWFAVALASAIVFATIYALFAWTSQLRNFVFSLIIGLAVVIIMRILIAF